MNGFPVFDNVEYITKEGHLTDPIRNNLTSLYSQLQNVGSSQTAANTDAKNPTPLPPDNNAISRGASIVQYQLPITCQINSMITVMNPQTNGSAGNGFSIAINPGQTIQWQTTVGTHSLAMTTDGASVTLYCVIQDTYFLVIAHEGTIVLS